MTSSESDLKKAAAERAVNDYVKNGMIIGLGTGSTANYAVLRVAELVKAGYDLTCVATSENTEKLAEKNGISIIPLDEVDHVDVTIDGADEIDPDLQLIKGLGGALLREKIVAAASCTEVIVADDSKLVKKLGMNTRLPVEVVPFGHTRTKYALERQGCKATLRMNNNEIFITDGGNYIYDCVFNGIDSLFFLESRINVIPGVVENGLFLNMATVAIVSHPDGSVTKMEKNRCP